jgi:hypothetical protein
MTQLCCGERDPSLPPPLPPSLSLYHRSINKHHVNLYPQATVHSSTSLSSLSYLSLFRARVKQPIPVLMSTINFLSLALSRSLSLARALSLSLSPPPPPCVLKRWCLAQIPFSPPNLKKPKKNLTSTLVVISYCPNSLNVSMSLTKLRRQR